MHKYQGIIIWIGVIFLSKIRDSVFNTGYNLIPNKNLNWR